MVDNEQLSVNNMRQFTWSCDIKMAEVDVREQKQINETKYYINPHSGPLAHAS